jgi:hypothetical protein
MGFRNEWEIEQERRKMLQEQMITEMKKDKFIQEMLDGLGEVIKKEPNKVQKKLSLVDKIKKLFS